MRKIVTLLSVFLLLGMQVAFSQSKEITGTVTSYEDGSTIPGASVIVKGTTAGTITDLDGRYKLNVPADATIVVSFVGYTPEELTVGDKTVVDVALMPSLETLTEIVVTAVGIKRETKALGYAVQEVKGDIINRGNNPNLINAINGKVSGVQITSSSGVAGASTFMTIRGASSIDQDNQPLYVIDGVPVDNSMLYSGDPNAASNNLLEGVAYSNRVLDLNPEDIESLTVLKGGAATALYGLRAGNGVIIITTKKGSFSADNKISVSYSGSVTFEKVNKLPGMQDKYGQGYAGLYDGPETRQSMSWGPRLDTCVYDNTTDPTYKWDKNGQIVGKSSNPSGKAVEPYDNYKNFFRTGVTYNHAINMMGGTEKSSYYFSMSDMKTNGVIPNNEYRRTTVKISGDAQLFPKIKAAGTVNYIKSGGVRIQQGSNLSGVMLGLLRTPPSFDNANGFEDGANEPDAYMFADGSQRNYRGGGGYDNPLWTVNRNQNMDDVNRLIGNFSLVYNPLEWITVTYRLGNDFYSDRRHGYFSIGSRAFTAGQVSDDHHFVQDINSDLLVSAKKAINKDIELIGTVGQNMFQHYYERTYVQGDGLTIPDFYNISNASSAIYSEAYDKKRTAAIFADFGVGYKSMLFLNFTGRNEWSTSLPAENNSFFYPSVNAGFVFTELGGLKDNKILSFGKFRTSYAVVASDADIYRTKNYFAGANMGDGWTNGVTFPFGGVNGFITNSTLGNSGIMPEKVKSFEVGTDLRFLQSRARFDFSYYVENSEDLLILVPIAASSGYVEQLMNAASMVNKGIEITAGGSPIKTKNFEWIIAMNFTKNNNEVLKLAEGVENVFLGGFDEPQVRAMVGKPYGTIYGLKWLRDGNGDVVIQDDPTAWNYGYPIVAPEVGEIGNTQVDWTAGLNNELRYKTFSVSFLFDFRRGGDMWNGTRGAMYYFGTHEDTEDREEIQVFEGVKGHTDADGNVISSGEVNDVAVPLGQAWYVDGEGSGFTGPSEPFVEEVNWIRMREISFNYSFDKKMLKETKIKGVDVFVSGKNQFLWTNYKGIDPETSLMGAVNSQGFDYFNMPNTKSWTFGVKLSF